MEQKIVVHYLDGRVHKGNTQNFNPAAPQFLLRLLDARPGQTPTPVDIKKVKAIFFVKDFAGDRSRADDKFFAGAHAYQGPKIHVTFADGEVVVGATPGYDPAAPGFFIFPADPKSNTIKIFASAAGVKEVKRL